MIGTLLNNSDTDNDGVSDFDEVNFDGDASDYNPASDQNAFDVDTDGDGVDDATELSAGTDRLTLIKDTRINDKIAQYSIHNLYNLL